jgi:hypothetical protein
MKTDFNTLIMIVCLVLALAIFVSVAFGCAFRKRREGFENKEEKTNANTSVSSNGLSKFENKLLEGLSGGNISTETIEKYIKDGSFTKENLSNMIKHVENLKNKKSK